MVGNINDLFFMQIALEQAKVSWNIHNEIPVGAVLVKNGQIIAVGSNLTITTIDPTAHAEIMVIRESSKILKNYRLNNTILYVTLEPCVMCFGAIIQARIAKVVFGAYDVKYGGISALANLKNYSYNHKFTCLGGVLAEASSTLLKNFFDSKRS